MIAPTETAIRAHVSGAKEPAWLLERRLAALQIFLRSRIRFPEPAASAIENAPRGAFIAMGRALRRYPELVRRYFGAAAAADAGPYAALNTALWSRGGFLYVPKGKVVADPVETGRFERTLIVADRGAKVECVEGCSALKGPGGALQAPVVEIVALERADVRFMTLQNWPSNVLNFATKRAIARAGARVRWLDGNVGSKKTVKRPVVELRGKGARGEILSVGLAGPGQTLELGGELIFQAAGASGEIAAHCASFGGGRCRARMKGKRRYLALDGGGAARRRLAFLAGRGFSSSAAKTLLTRGFFFHFLNELPLEFSVEFNRMIELEFEAAQAKLD